MSAVDLSQLEDRRLRWLVVEAVRAANLGVGLSIPHWRAWRGDEAIWRYANALVEARRSSAPKRATVSRNVPHRKRKGKR